MGGGGVGTCGPFLFIKVVSSSSVLFRTSVLDSDPGVLRLHIKIKIDAKKIFFTFFPNTRTRIIGSLD